MLQGQPYLWWVQSGCNYCQYQSCWEQFKRWWWERTICAVLQATDPVIRVPGEPAIPLFPTFLLLARCIMLCGGRTGGCDLIAPYSRGAKGHARTRRGAMKIRLNPFGTSRSRSRLSEGRVSAPPRAQQSRPGSTAPRLLLAVKHTSLSAVVLAIAVLISRSRSASDLGQ